MAETTFEEAKRCPKCQVPGMEVREQKLAENKGKVHFIECINPVCKWFQTSWMVQVRPDGTIPDMTKDTDTGERSFPKMSQEQIDMGRRVMEDIEQRDLRGRDS
jgi:hypothetical protein